MRIPADLLFSVHTIIEDLLEIAQIKESDDPIFLATGIDNLDPENVELNMLEELPFSPSVRYHSIIGNKDSANMPNGSDGIVPYNSSHLDGAESEIVVHSTHGVQKTLPAIDEVRRILLLHLKDKKND